MARRSAGTVAQAAVAAEALEAAQIIPCRGCLSPKMALNQAWTLSLTASLVRCAAAGALDVGLEASVSRRA